MPEDGNPTGIDYPTLMIGVFSPPSGEGMLATEYAVVTLEGLTTVR